MKKLVINLLASLFAFAALCPFFLMCDDWKICRHQEAMIGFLHEGRAKWEQNFALMQSAAEFSVERSENFMFSLIIDKKVLLFEGEITPRVKGCVEQMVRCDGLLSAERNTERTMTGFARVTKMPKPIFIRLMREIKEMTNRFNES